MSLQRAARAKRFGLRSVDVKELCLKRRRRGTGFIYVDGQGLDRAETALMRFLEDRFEGKVVA